MLLNRIAAALTVLFLSVTIAHSQRHIVRGSVSDSLSGEMLFRSAICLLNPADSTLIAFTRSDANGHFSLNATAPGPYIVKVYHPGYVIFSDVMTIGNGAVTDVGALRLLTKAHLLEEVVVRQNRAIRFKNDTTEFNADSFKVRASANAEELLRRLPGFSIDRKGAITVSGERVRTVLVDGEEFFGNDPTMATRNINANDVAKVQLFDKASTASTLTGIADNEKKKAVNLVLKDDAKRGYFGKAEGGTDFDKYYQGKLTGNKFSSTSKKGVFASADRTGSNEMTFGESQDYGNTILTFDGSSVRIGGTIDSYDASEAEGIPESRMAAAMLNNKYGDQAFRNNTVNNYSFRQQRITADRTTRSTYILNDTTYKNSVRQGLTSDKFRHSLNTKNEFNIDSFNVINLNAKGEVSEYREVSEENGELRRDTSVINDYLNRTNSTTRSVKGRFEVFWRRKFRKPGRLLAVNVNLETDHSTSKGFLYNNADLYSHSQVSGAQLVDQRKDNRLIANGWQGLVSYTEPLSRQVQLNLNYTITSSQSTQSFQSFEKKGLSYDSLNNQFSSDFDFLSVNHKAGSSLNYTFKAGYLRTNLSVQDIYIKQVNLQGQAMLQRHFTSILPSINYRIKTKQTTFTAAYSGSMQQPSFNQLQPFINNANPINIVLGNPELVPAYFHTFSGGINNYNSARERSLVFSTNVSLTDHAFGYSDFIDTFGRRVITPVNVSGNSNYSFMVNYSCELRKQRIMIDFFTRYRINHVNNIVNGQANRVVSRRISAGLKVDKHGQHFDGYIWYQPEYSFTRSSIQPDQKINYLTNIIEARANLDITKTLLLSSDIVSEIRPKVGDVFANNAITIWNVSLEKRLSPKQDIRVAVAVYDILNQRKGIDRSVSTNFVSEYTYTTIQRYALVSIKWRFSKNRPIGKND